MKSLAVALMAASAAIVLMGQARASSSVRTDRLDLVDAAGKTRATLSVVYVSNASNTGPDVNRGTPSRTFYGRNGERTLEIGLYAEKDIPHLQMWDANTSGPEAVVDLVAFWEGQR